MRVRRLPGPFGATVDRPPVTVGIRVPHEQLSGGAHSLRAAIDQVVGEEIDRVCVGDHVTFHGGAGFDGLVQAAALAALCDLEVQTAVYLLPLRHPVPVARQVNSLAQLAPGRFVFGVGIGGEDPAEVRACGVDPATRGRRMDEALSIVRELLVGEPLTWRGDFFELDEVRIAPPPREPVPIVVGGRSEAALRRAGRLGDGYLALWTSPERFVRSIATVEHYAAEAGRSDVAWRHGLHVWCGFDDERGDGPTTAGPGHGGSLPHPVREVRTVGPARTSRSGRRGPHAVRRRRVPRHQHHPDRRLGGRRRGGRRRGAPTADRPTQKEGEGETMSHQDRVSIVTGGTRGLGAAVTERLVDAGAHVAAVYVGNTAAAEALAGRLADRAGSVSLHRVDVGDPDACSALVDDVVARHGRLDHLVNNAGLLVENTVRRTSLEEWDAAVRVNLSSAFYLIQAALTPMVEARFGRIVNVSSVTAVMGSPVEAAYGAAKAGMLGLTRSVAREVVRKGVTVNTVVPGVFETDMTNAMEPAAQEAIRNLIPLGRRGDPHEFAHAVMFLLDDLAAYVTGAVITIDGGLSMGG